MLFFTIEHQYRGLINIRDVNDTVFQDQDQELRILSKDKMKTYDGRFIVIDITGNIFLKWSKLQRFCSFYVDVYQANEEITRYMIDINRLITLSLISFG